MGDLRLRRADECRRALSPDVRSARSWHHAGGVLWAETRFPRDPCSARRGWTSPMGRFEPAAGAEGVDPRIRDVMAACIQATAVDGGGMSLLASSGAREPVYGSDPTAETLERLQFTLGEGPCVDAAAGRSPVLVPDLAAPWPGSGVAERWPAFLAEALGLGVRAVFAFPLRIGPRSLGALDLYRGAAGPLDDRDVARSLATADTIALALLEGGAGTGGDLSPEPLRNMEVHRSAPQGPRLPARSRARTEKQYW